MNRLKDRDAAQIAQKARVNFDGAVFRFTSLGRQITVTCPDYQITPRLENWHHLLVLHYLNLADGAPLTGKQISFGQYSNGVIRGGDFDRRAELFFRECETESLRMRCLSLGGMEKATGADLCMELPFLPMYPITVNFWQADEDFPASGRLTVDRSAPHYLSVEDAVTAGELIMKELRTRQSC